MSNKDSLATIDDFLWSEFGDVIPQENLVSCTSGTLNSRTTGTLSSRNDIDFFSKDRVIKKDYSGEFDIYSYLGEGDNPATNSDNYSVFSDYYPKPKKLEDVYRDVYGTLNSSGTSIIEHYNKRDACVFDARPEIVGTLKKRKEKFFTYPKKKPSRFNIKNLFGNAK